MEIHIKRPDLMNHEDPVTWDHLCAVINDQRGPVLDVAEKAFRDGDRQSWEQIEAALYLWNTEDLERLLHPTSFSSMAHRALRNMVVALENTYRAQHSLKSWSHFSTDVALQELYDAAASHRIGHHPLLEHMRRYGLSARSVRLFLDNYYVNNRLFHLHIATLSCSTPLLRRNDLYANLFDELGGEDAHLAHPLLFLRNYDTIGRSEVVEPLPESLYLLNTKVALTHLSDNCLLGFGGLGFIEIVMPRQMQCILAGLKRSGLPDRDLIFWETHIKIDEAHGRNWFTEMREMVSCARDAEMLLNGGEALLEARACVYDGMWRAVKDEELGRHASASAVSAA